MEIKVNMCILNEEKKPFMGIGLVQLLERIKKFKSINKAAADMKMSYAKALKILNRLEENLSEKVIIRKKGGSIRNQTEVTPFAEKYIQDYYEYQKKIKVFADKEFVKLANQWEN